MRALAKGLHALALSLALLVSGCSKPSAPRLTPLAVRVSSITPATLGVTIDLDVYNPNSFPLVVHAVDGTLLLGSGAELGKAHAEPRRSIPAQGSLVVSTELVMAWTQLHALAPFAASGRPVPFRLQGNAQIGGERLNVSVPFEIQGELTRAQVLQAGLRGLEQLLPAAPSPSAP